MSERQYVLAYGKDYLDPKTTRKTATADALIKACRRFHVIPISQDEYKALGAKERAVWKKSSGYIVGGEFGAGKTKSDCKFRSLVTLDLDAITPESANTLTHILHMAGNKGFIYSTDSHRPDAPRLRVVIFLAQDVAPEDYKRLVKHYADLLPAGAVSAESFQVAQIVYLPQACKDGEQIFI
jgi:putative DNA primase/helicase